MSNKNETFEKVLLKDVNSSLVSKVIYTSGVIKSIKKPVVKLDTAIFLCRGCMKIHEVKQNHYGDLIEPSLCDACGGRFFNLLQEESKYRDMQEVTISTTYRDEYDRSISKDIKLLLKDDDVYKIRKNDSIAIIGVLKTFHVNRNSFELYIDVSDIKNHIPIMEK